jgi:galactose mutarotase-like enzyme
VTLKSDKGKRKVTVSYPELPYLGLWHAPGVEAPYLCIEPWASLPSRQDIIEEFRYKSDLIRLSPGREYVNKWGITIE